MSSRQEERRRNADADEEAPGTQPAVEQKSTDDAELSDQDLEDVAGGAKGVAVGRGIRGGSVYEEDVESQ